MGDSMRRLIFRPPGPIKSNLIFNPPNPIK